MKLVASIAALMLIGSTEAIQRHHQHVADVTFVETLPDERPATVSDSDIAAHEAARDEAAKVKKNPQTAFFADVRENLNQISKDLSFGVSFSQKTRNDHARTLVTSTAKDLKKYADQMIAKTEATPNESLTEQNAHNIATAIFYDVQLQDAASGLGMAALDDLTLSVNRLKSLQKLYLFEQKGGENYLG
jgi:hypothetical protein